MYTLITESESNLGEKVVAYARSRGHEVVGVDKKNGDYIHQYNVPSFEMFIDLSGRKFLFGPKWLARRIVKKAEPTAGLRVL